MVTQDDLSTKPTEAPSADEGIQVEEVKEQVIQQEAPKEIFTVVEEQPGYPGGDEARIKYLQDNIKYPDEAKELGVQGKVFVTFVVEVDGSITDVRVLRGIGAGCDEEAIRVVRNMPKWVPGKQRGVPVRVQFNLPIKFTLQ
jgi:periplasmic protein TonB